MRLFAPNLSLTKALPLVRRELRAESRRPVNYWLRVLTAAVIIGVFASFLASTELVASELGAGLFAALRRALALAIWIIVPMMTADCLSREKREGTLGLLFLTPLSVLDVMLGKAATHILRAATLLLASVPVLVLPFVLGGVSWQLALMAVATIANALLLAIGAGLYASAKGGSATQVMVMAEGYALVLVIISGVGHFFIYAIIYGLGGIFFRWTMGPPFWAWASWLGSTVGMTLLLFPLVIYASIRLLRDTWDRDSSSPEQPEWVALFSDSAFWRTAFQWKRSRTLDRNPIAWLQEYSWTARLTKWAWFLAFLLAELFMLVSLPGWQPYLIAVLSLGVAFSATASFRRERQSGLLEILLVTPLSVRQLILGRLWGIGSHFLPAYAVLAVCWDGERLLNSRVFLANPAALVWPNPLGFVALMVVGLYLSLRRLNFLALWLLAWTLAFLLPALFSIALDQFGVLPRLPNVALTSALQLALAGACGFLLRRDMRERRFVNAETVGVPA